MSDLERRIALLERGLRRLGRGLDETLLEVDQALAWYGAVSRSTGTPPFIPDPVDRVQTNCCQQPVPTSLNLRAPNGLTGTLAHNGSTWSGVLTVLNLELRSFSCQRINLFGSTELLIDLRCGGTFWQLLIRAYFCGSNPYFPRPVLASSTPILLFASSPIPTSSGVCNPFNLVFTLISTSLPNWGMPSPGQWIVYE